jgi:hypothetical protein
MQSALRRATAFLTPGSSSTNLSAQSPDVVTTAKSPTSLFPQVSTAVDGPDCLHDCDSCAIAYPKKFSINESDALYGHAKGWATHMLVATGKDDWVRDVADEKGSVMEAVGKHGQDLVNGRLMLSASNIPLPWGEDGRGQDLEGGKASSVVLLPAWKVVEGVRPRDVPRLLEEVVATGPTNMTPLKKRKLANEPVASVAGEHAKPITGPSHPPTPPSESLTPDPTSSLPTDIIPPNAALSSLTSPQPPPFSISTLPHDYLILLCSQRTRDARCGISAPLLRREFERHLRPLDLYRDLNDTRPGGVGIYFISHVGGHKYSANVMVYRRAGATVASSGDDGTAVSGEEGAGDAGAAQAIWLARVRPEDCEGIVKYTVLTGKVVKPERQLRGGFDRGRCVVSW